MKNRILELRSQGKSYKEIKNQLGCSNGTISYHCGNGQKEKSKNRARKRSKKNKLLHRVELFKTKRKRNLVENTRKFQKISGNKIDNSIVPTFTWKDVVSKFGINTKCYLSGENINILQDDYYNLDHIIPVSKGGSNFLDNMGILHKDVNYMKGNLSKEELIEWCKKILIYNGFRVESVHIFM